MGSLGETRSEQRPETPQYHPQHINQISASMGFCSAVTLAFATIFSLVAAALLAISFSTDNWITVTVQRQELKNEKLQVLSDQLQLMGRKNVDIAQLVDESPLYFTRTRGLFRECFLGEKSDDPEKTNAPLGDLIQLYMSPVETWCRNVDYFIPDENGVTKTFNAEEMTRIHMMRAMIALFIVGFFFMFVSFTAGILGCWKTSPSNITASAILMLIACLFHAILPPETTARLPLWTLWIRCLPWALLWLAVWPLQLLMLTDWIVAQNMKILFFHQLMKNPPVISFKIFPQPGHGHL